jgi:hypothetical protein
LEACATISARATGGVAAAPAAVTAAFKKPRRVSSMADDYYTAP